MGPARVALTGGTGFVGAALLRRLSGSGVRVRSFSRSGAPSGAPVADWVIREKLDVDAARALLENAEVVFHCAGSIRDPKSYVAANVDMVRTLAPVAAEMGVRWVQLGSLGVFSGLRSGRVTEESEPCPVGPYEESKAEADRILLREAERNGLAVSILRVAAVVDSGMPSPWLRNLVAFFSGRRSFLVAGGTGILSLSPLPSVVDAMIACGSGTAAGARIFHLAQSISFERLRRICRNRSQGPAFSLSIPEWLARGVSRGAGWIPGFPVTPERIDIFTRAAEFPSYRIGEELGYREEHPIEPFLDQVISAWRGPK